LDTISSLHIAGIIIKAITMADSLAENHIASCRDCQRKIQQMAGTLNRFGNNFRFL